ncbi:MAG: uracil phosphoribosyltransferase [Elusimicrobia bacterium]|nr:uracil phosphoribosyltransferase [Elusimicrobiota bacterium]
MPGRLIVSDHPLVQEKLALLRDRRTTPAGFRCAMETASALMGCEALRGLRTKVRSVPTPLKRARAVALDQSITLVAVLRAGLGMLGGLLDLAPAARIGHIGLYRNEETLNPVRYYVRLPPDLKDSFLVLCDPMLATGGSAAEALRIVKTDGARQIALLCIIASRAGVRRVHSAHPDVPIYTAGLDPRLDRKGYILPGLGDAGDRLFAT